LTDDRNEPVVALATLENDGDPDLRTFWVQLSERYGIVPSLLRVVANSPTTLQAWVSFVGALREESGGSTGRLQEMVIMRASAQSANTYELERHSRSALSQDLCTAEEIARLRGELILSEWDPLEAALLRATDHVVAGDRLQGPDLDDLKGQLTSDALVRFVLLAAFYVAIDRVVKSLDVQLQHDAMP
jgi:alkylhydroperoxidase family enzyme